MHGLDGDGLPSPRGAVHGAHAAAAQLDTHLPLVKRDGATIRATTPYYGRRCGSYYYYYYTRFGATTTSAHHSSYGRRSS